MRVSILLALPSLAAAAPVWGQDCDVECEAALEYERNQAGAGSAAKVLSEAIGAMAAGGIYVDGRLENPLSDATTDFVTLRADTGASDRIENALLYVPGLQQFRRSDARSANPTSQGITLRGLGGNASSRALLFLDDVPQADPFGGWVSWPAYDAVDPAQVRVNKGGGQPSAGPGALAGVIELDSFQSTKIGTIWADYGSRNSVEGRVRYADFLGNGSYSAGLSYARGDGFTPIVAGQRGAADGSAKYEQVGLALRGVAPLNEAVELQASLRGFTDNRNRGVDFSDNENSGVDASLRLAKRRGDWQWSATTYVQVREFSSQFSAVAADRNSVTPTLDQFATPSTGLGVRFEMRPPVGENAELRLGGEWRRTDGVTKELFTFVGGSPTRLRTAGGRTDSYGGFAETSLKLGEEVTLSAGGRFDRWTIADGFRREVNIGGTVRSDDRYANRSGTEWTGRAGIGWNRDDELKFHAAVYRAWRLPTLNELYRPFRVGADATAANEALQTERVKGAEIGARIYGWDFELGANLFVNRIEGAIANVTLGQGPGTFSGVGFVAVGGTYRRRQNLDAIVSKGIELDGDFDLTNDLTLKFGYAFVDAEVLGAGASAPLDGLRPAQVPKHSGIIVLLFSSGDFGAEAAFRYLGRQFEDDANSRKLSDAVTSDLSLGYKVTNRLELQLRAENLFDARVETAISSTGIIERASPRTIWFGLRYDLE